MDDAMKKQQAQKMYNIFCQALDANDWKYRENEEELQIECGAQGEDLPMELVIRMDVPMQVIQVFSCLPYTIPEDKRLDVAVAVSTVNNKLVHGCFDYNIADGRLFFRMNGSFRDFLLSQESCAYMLYCTCTTIDNYNDKLLMMSKGMLKLEDFLKAEVE